MDHWSVDIFGDDEDDLDANGNAAAAYLNTDLNGNDVNEESAGRRFRRLCRSQHRNDHSPMIEQGESEMLLL